MNTIYLPNTQEVQDLLTAIEDIQPNGLASSRDCIEVKTENAQLAAFLKSLNFNTNGSRPAAVLTERTCRRCGKQFDPTRPNQYTCSKCLADIARKRTSGKNGQGSPATATVSDPGYTTMGNNPGYTTDATKA